MAANRTATDDAPGPHTVHVRTFADKVDARRFERRVPMNAFIPDGTGSYPLVIISHGAGGTRDTHADQAEHLASHGYVVLCLQHPCSDRERLKYFMSRAGGRLRFMDAIHRITCDADAILGRPGDVRYAIDQATLWNERDPVLKGRIQLEKIGVMGHSFGAYTTLAVCGARPIRDHAIPRPVPATGLYPGMRDPRVTFGFAMSPPPVGGTFFSEESLKTIQCPLVCLTGSEDQWKDASGAVRDPAQRLVLFDQLPAGDVNYIWLEGADHAAFSGGTGLSSLPSRARADTQRISKALMVVCSDYYLKGRTEASARMNEAYARTLCGRAVTDVKWMKK